MTSHSKTSTDIASAADKDRDRLAQTLPDWDLLPGHSVLTRRRPSFVRAQPSAPSNPPQSAEPTAAGTEG